MGKGFVDLQIVTPLRDFSRSLTGAIVWDLITWWLGLPTSSSHALIGGYAGACVARAIYVYGVAQVGCGTSSSGKWPTTLLFIVLAPLIGFLLAYLLMTAVYLPVPKIDSGQDGLLFPQAATGLGGAVQLRPRLQ